MSIHIAALIEEAKKRMSASCDKLHDLGHASRVSTYSAEIGRELALGEEETQIIILASWWHDTARSLTRKPSVLWMRCIDDFISGFLLSRAAKRLHMRENEIVSQAIRIIVSKNIGTTRLFTKFILSPKYRTLLSIVQDADALDALHLSRLNGLKQMAENSLVYRHMYKWVVWWFLHSRELEFQTDWARRYFGEEVLKNFMLWFRTKEIFEWHSEVFSQKWLEKRMNEGEIFMQTFQVSFQTE
ncbi:MAG: hypothetical protein A3B90_02140 [Candidatus Magasanikbacteria bacterium RIFCSPHIGHO2_02_FULL_41_13]|uniref:HD domain-containing protein n=1 Tax=Candidatus Magasanikbacteria bacterium RIFCSPHIGHO2_02_FULL_41_13 TaxID=1798676 RepID=A0A1F6M660_9BACT|nr:MAG: hypothetical protein A3B90_02140 [Candidatus Magasanikbacteria bacterium RIFCSPHIGHO2_02_FULL_41_13]